MKSFEYAKKVCRVVMIVAAALYVIDPADFVPDVIPVLGWSDDAIAFLLGARECYKMFFV